ncbi:MAG: hypothetical protein IJ418_08505, partial [Clostridia bacterium]|nr:hypothetical protein [Clostridia bacterium]
AWKFYLPKDAIDSFAYCEEPITISKLAYLLNGTYKTDEMCYLKAMDVTRVLEEEGYLTSILLDNGQKSKIPTERGLEAGITYQEKMNSEGEKYYTCYYNVHAQKMVLTYLIGLIEIENR